ncbi:MAG: hypothetical protein U5R31_04585 [Acidimicrobiia bacterium]|nr:hypothetical protein [Acidimicrobiia bacterium]
MAAPAEELDRITFFWGHLPLVAARLVDPALPALILLRDPVDRAVSFLKQIRRDVRPGASLEELYEEEWLAIRVIDNHQTKVLSLSATEALAPPTPDQLVEPPDDGWSEEELEVIDRGRPTDALPWERFSMRLLFRIVDPTVMRPIVMDDQRLDVAARELEGVDVVGVNRRLRELPVGRRATAGDDPPERPPGSRESARAGQPRAPPTDPRTEPSRHRAVRSGLRAGGFACPRSAGPVTSRPPFEATSREGGRRPRGGGGPIASPSPCLLGPGAG